MSANSATSSQTPLPRVSQPTLILRLTIPNFPSERNARGQKHKEGKLLFSVPCVPSWNDLLSLDEWGRKRLKNQIGDAFLSALRASASDSGIPITLPSNGVSIFADTLAAYRTTALVRQKLKQRNARLKKAKKSTPL